MFTDTLDEESNSSRTKMTQKSHHHGWLARKFFRRSSSTYTLKAKTTYKPITRKKSFGGIRLLSDDAPTNILSGKSLEEACRLGGLGILVLPPDFAADRLSLPTCLSATAAYLLENGMSSLTSKLLRQADSQAGCNAPGIFRVSGTATTINELYRYFDHQFSDAGSPSKVEATVGTGYLPSDPEYTLPDIASLFKKIIIGLPGGLLGSLELFEALRGIVLTWRPDPELSAADPIRLRARLIALAILSVTSVYRVFLIQAVLGLVAHFGFEADKAQAAERASTEGRPRQGQQESELMGYQSLGKVLGPLLLGELNDCIEVSGGAETFDGALHPRKSAELHQENTKKSKKQKRNSVPNKIEKDANLTAHVDRANLAAEVMHLLLLNWRDVVKQLRELNGLSSFLQPSKSMTQIKKMPSRIATRYSTNTSEDNARFLEILRGRSIPDEFEQFRGPVKMKRRVRITSRSPMARGATKFSEGGDEGHTWRLGNSEGQAGESPSGSNATEFGAPNAGSAINTRSSTLDVSELATDRRTKSDLAMDQMAMGTILTPLKDSSVSPKQKLLLRHVTSAETPLRQSRTRSSNDAPTTAVRVAARSMQRNASVRLVHQSSTDELLPSIGDAQRAECIAGSSVEYFPSTALDEEESRKLHERIMSSRRSRRSRASADSSPFATRQVTPRTLFPSRSSGHWTPPEMPTVPLPEAETMYPPRQSSLRPEQGSLIRPIDPLPTFESMAEYKAWCELHPSSPNLPPASRKISESRPADEETDRTKRNSSGSVKFLAQKFTEVSRVTRNDEQARQAAKDGDMLKVYAYVHPIPQPLSPLYDPFVSTTSLALDRSPSSEKETLIPRPIREVGRGRSAERSRSPIKTTASPKRTAPPSPKEHVGKRLSILNIVRDQDAKIIMSNVRGDDGFYSDARSTVDDSPEAVRHLEPTSIDSSYQSTSQDSDALTSRPFSYESIRHLQSGSERPKSWHNPRVLSIGRPLSTSQSDDQAFEKGYFTSSSPSRINTYRNASDALKQLERHGSINATLYQEIMRLQRLLEHRGEEVQAARRSLDAVREARDARDANPKKFSPRNSWSKGTMSEDIKEANSELSIWRRRAEEAEKRLANIGGLAEKAAEKHGVNVDVLLERGGEGPVKRQGIDVEVLVARKGQERERVVELYMDEGWGGDALTLSSEDVHLRSEAK